MKKKTSKKPRLKKATAITALDPRLFYAAIGDVAAAWGSIEELLDSIIVVLMKANETYALPVISPMNARVKFQIFRDLIALHEYDKNIKLKAGRLTDRLDKLRAERNLIIHANWTLITASGDYVGATIQYVRKEKCRMSIEKSRKDIIQLANSISKAYREFKSLIIKDLGLPKTRGIIEIGTRDGKSVFV